MSKNSLEELQDLEAGNTIIGAGSYGQCNLKKITMLGIQVVEKQLHESNLDEIYKDACYIQ